MKPSAATTSEEVPPVRTPFGEKKNTSGELAKSYAPALVEASWYEWWEKRGFFTPAAGSNKPKYVIVIPPPNVTGALHIGHALTNSIQARCIGCDGAGAHNGSRTRLSAGGGWVGTKHCGCRELTTRASLRKLWSKRSLHVSGM